MIYSSTMAEEMKISAPSGFPIGNCKVTIEGSSYSCSSTGQNLEISVSNAAKINISVHGESDSLMSNLSFLLVNPKDADDQSKTLMQEALRLYVKELPTMNYAANTGKESNFLERCVSSGKYCTLLLRLNIGGLFTEVIAALTYQIIPADTQYAEVPLAAVSSNYQHKGIGRLLYSELKNRLRNVGICTVLCWGDRESEGFWIKQGFEIIAEVDVKGKVRKLPIKADIRRALCFPGGSSLMVSYLNKSDNITSNPTSHIKSHVPLVYHAKSSSPLPMKRQEHGGLLECHGTSKGSLIKNGLMLNEILPQIEDTRSSLLVNDGCTIDNKNDDGSSLQEHSFKELAPSNLIDNNNALTDVRMRGDGDGCTTDDKNYDDSSLQQHSTKEVATLNLIDVNNERKDNEQGTDGKRCGYSTRSAKRKTWETSLTSIKSKKVKGGHHVNHSSWDLDSETDEGTNSSPDTRPLSTYIRKFRKKETVPKDTVKNNCQPLPTEPITDKDQIQGKLLSKGDCHRIMLMDIADDAKKAFLTKIVEDLGGAIASEGHISTHVITLKARKTRNFCVALSSGAWIVSTNWLKQSFREGKFLDESPFVLQDQDYTSKYKSELKDAVLRAKTSPRALLNGYDICLAKHVQPPFDILSDIAKSAGGNVIRTLSKVKEPSRTIFVACEEDMEEAMLAAKRGVWSFSSDWFMSCVMRQELDMDAPQFAESL